MAEKNYALYNKQTGLIENVVHWDEELNPNVIWPDPYGVVVIPEIEHEWLVCGIGWSYIDGKFIEPPKPPEPDKK